MSEIYIDGGRGEGGGQIIRFSLSLTSLLRSRLQIDKIRHNRPKPGLRPQHLMGVNICQSISRGKMKGNEISSTKIEFDCTKTKQLRHLGEEIFDCKTAGSITLLLQQIIPILLFSDGPSIFDVIGGTNVSHSPTIEYMTDVLLPTLNDMNVDCTLKVLRHGVFPRGQGRVRCELKSLGNGKLKAIQLMERGEVREIIVKTFASGKLRREHQEDCEKRIRNFLSQFAELSNVLKFEHKYESYKECAGDCLSILITMKCNKSIILGFDVLIDNAKLMDGTVNDLCDEFKRIYLANVCVDEKMQDQLLIYMALAEGSSSMRCNELTSHSSSALHTIRQFIPIDIEIKPCANGTNVIHIKGMSYCVNKLKSDEE
ncbi:hypothetical protein SNEBB_009041 [Seison nebaliae]|nr:hypothetical protein SNEBB_009041 [Seison nebaliae]